MSSVPLKFGASADAGPTTALLIEGDGFLPEGRAAARFSAAAPVAAHPLGCACCLPRAPAASALSALFLARARGEVPFFEEIVAVTRTQAGHAAVLRALEDDPLASTWFHLA